MTIKRLKQRQEQRKKDVQIPKDLRDETAYRLNQRAAIDNWAAEYRKKFGR